jgi:hypothetical protein
MHTFLFAICFLQTLLAKERSFLDYLFDVKDNKVVASIGYNPDSHLFEVKKGVYDKNYIAYATYDASLIENGWDTLAISSYLGDDKQYSDHEKAYSMGYLEGVLTVDRIWTHYQNMKYKYEKRNDGHMPEIVKEFLLENIQWVEQQDHNDPFWYHANLFIVQMKGIVEGYNSQVNNDRKINIVEMQMINADAELGDIGYVDPSKRPKIEKMSSETLYEYVESRSRCSALIKVAPDFSDVWFGHNTWSGFTSMTRIFKEYRFRSNLANEKVSTVAFSGYPGSLSSIDDFYITDKDLYVTETTNEIFDMKLWDKLTPHSLLTWHRAMIANRLAVNGRDWSAYFSKANSGTYNNQFQILDLKLIDTENKVINDGALWIAEQMPGLVVSDDKTEILRLGYWPSYNSAYFQEIREKSGYNKQLKEHPDLKDKIDYSTCARANIFRRDQGNVTDLEAYKSLLRYNGWQTDPLSKGKPNMSIACRADLAVDPQCRGAIDGKAASIHDIKGKAKKKIHIVSGPTTQGQTPFRTDAKCTAKADQTFVGLPVEFNYSWIVYETQLFDNN